MAYCKWIGSFFNVQSHYFGLVRFLRYLQLEIMISNTDIPSLQSFTRKGLLIYLSLSRYFLFVCFSFYDILILWKLITITWIIMYKVILCMGVQSPEYLHKTQGIWYISHKSSAFLLFCIKIERFQININWNDFRSFFLYRMIYWNTCIMN